MNTKVTAFEVKQEAPTKLNIKFGTAEFNIIVDPDGSFRFQWDTPVSLRPNTPYSFNLARR